MSAELDLIALGETMLSFVAVDGPIDVATSFRPSYAGAESNACVAAVRAGARAAWVSKLGADPTGDRIVAALEDAGVDVMWVRRDPDRPTGLMVRDRQGGVRHPRAQEDAAAHPCARAGLRRRPSSIARDPRRHARCQWLWAMKQPG